MDGIVSICFINMSFKCPHCNTSDKDEKEKLLNTKRFSIIWKCKGCGFRYRVTQDITGDYVTYPDDKLNKIVL